MESTTPNVKCSCGRTVPPFSPHRLGRNHPGFMGAKREVRKTSWCPETDKRKQAEEEAKAAREKAATEPQADPAPSPAPAAATEEAQ